MRILVSAVMGFLLVTGGITGFSTSVAAGAKPILAVGPGIADSDCVGETTTPVCTVETWLACMARKDAELCARATPDHVKVLFRPDAAQLVYKYQISAVQVISRERITESLKSRKVEPGDVEVRLLQYSRLYKGGNFNVDSPSKESFFLTPRNGNWIIRAWTDDYAPRSCEMESADERYGRECYIYIYQPDEPWVHDSNVESKME